MGGINFDNSKIGRNALYHQWSSVLLGAGILLGLHINVFTGNEYLLDAAMIIVLLSSLLTILGLLSVTRYQNETYQENITNLENLNRKLREQRHDYLNQIQIVYGLLELEEYEEARAYMRPVFKDLMKVNKALKTSEPAVNALLQAKMETAEKQGIDFYLEITTQMKSLSIEAWELCKILANLIDNAVTAVLQREGEKHIVLNIREISGSYQFTVRNNGPEIPKHMRNQIFRQGFTTKKEEGHGLGLSIVSNLIHEAGGELSMETGEKETSFQFTIPIKQAGRIQALQERRKEKLRKVMERMSVQREKTTR